MSTVFVDIIHLLATKDVILSNQRCKNHSKLQNILVREITSKSHFFVQHLNIVLIEPVMSCFFFQYKHRAKECNLIKAKVIPEKYILGLRLKVRVDRHTRILDK